MSVFCGVDWAEGHHDVALVDGEGRLVAKRRINETPEGFAEFTAMLAEAGDCAEQPIPVAIETPRGLLVAALRAAGRAVYPINPLAVARYRERTSMSGKKSDHHDAMALANILRTDAHLHRQLPDDTDLARSISVLARAHQDAVWRRTKLVQELRARLREYHPGFLAAFGPGSGAGSGMSTTQLASNDARAVLALAPSPAEAQRASTERVETALRRGGRQRNIPARAAAIVAALRVPQLRHDRLVEQALRVEALALLDVLNAVCQSIEQLAAAVTEAFRQHPDYTIITSFPGLADISGAIVLAEVGDDRARFADDRALQAFAGSAPVTRASGKSRSVVRRRTKNNRLAAVGFSWAFTAAARPSPAREHYLRRRERGDGHPAALRHLFNRMLGQLHHCLQTGQTYDPVKAFPHRPTHVEPLAA
ncbi:IS110 family transposase [Amycolatopsis sp. CA-161197]|uniref:IS110 family transposase n=1 Tax=Amycolatopsis sp. CA-161197 TaxID=3239922 RepID=UPI003D922F85